MPYPELKGLLTDIGTEELGHLEMVGTIVHQLTRTLTQEQIESAGFANYFVDHTAGVYPQAASGTPHPRAPTPVHFCKAAHTGRPDAISSGLPQNTTALPEDCVSFRAVTLHYMGKGHRYLHTGTLGGWQYYLGTSCFHLQRRMHKPNFRFPRSA